MFLSSLRRLASASVVAALAACGGGGDGPSADAGQGLPSATLTLAVDPSIAARVAAVHTPLQTATSDKSQIVASTAAPHGLAFATDASGTVSGISLYGAADGSLAVSAEETALALAWLDLGGHKSTVSVADSKAQIRASAAFAPLAAAIAKGQGLFTAEVTASRQALVEDLMAAAEPVQAAMLVPRSDFLPKRLIGAGRKLEYVEVRRKSGAAVDLKSTSGLTWQVSTQRPYGETVADPGPLTDLTTLEASGGLGWQLGWPPVSVSSITRPVNLTEGSQRLVLRQTPKTLETNVYNIVWDAMSVSAGILGIGGVEFDALFECGLNTMLGALKTRIGDAATAGDAELLGSSLADAVVNMLSPTSAQNMLKCVPRLINQVNSGWLDSLSSIAKSSVLGKASAAVETVFLMGKASSLYFHLQNPRASSTGICVANGTVVSDDCDVFHRFDVETLSSTVSEPAPHTIRLENGSTATIFCGAPDTVVSSIDVTTWSDEGKVLLTYIYGDNEEVDGTGTYNYRDGTITVSDASGWEPIAGHPNYSTRWSWSFQGKIDLKTRVLSGELKDSSSTSWRFDGTVQTCTRTITLVGSAQGNR